MHMKASDKDLGPEIVPVKFILEDPEPLTGKDEKEIHLKAAIGESILELALDHGINIEHACGGVCGCSTCHIHIDKGGDCFDEPEDDELDRVDEAPGVELNSRLACQAIVKREGTIEVRIPSWNRNAVKEVPH